MNDEQLAHDGFELPEELNSAIKAYNQVSKAYSIKKLFYLQKINYHVREFMAKAHQSVIEWYHQDEAWGFERHLQRFGIHRDSSELLQSIEFAQAVALRSEHSSHGADKSFHQSLRDRDKTFLATNKTEDDTIKEYCENNLRIWGFYSNDEELKTTVLRQINFLALIYAKTEAIQGLVEQRFEGYTSKAMSAHPSNNQNFIFTVNDNKLVIRVEDRNSLGKDRQLQTYPVSNYFIEEYALLMVPFGEEQQKVYHPVVISEFAKQGNLKIYARSLSKKNDEDIFKKTVDIFEQMSDFCLKLKESGHYHPDIKLTNFLVHDDKLRISDRKTLINIERPKASLVCSSYNFAPPEYQDCFNSLNNGLVVAKASKIQTTYVDMNSFMSYQLGRALKAFMLESLNPSFDKDNKALDDQPITDLIPRTNVRVRNLSALIQALTQKKSTERLSIENFKVLLKKIKYSELEFSSQLNTFTPIIPSAPVNLNQIIEHANPSRTGEFVREPTQMTEEDKKASFIRCDTKRLNARDEEIKRARAERAVEYFREHELEHSNEKKQKPISKIAPAAITAQVAFGDAIPKIPKTSKEDTYLNNIFYSVVYALVGGASGAFIGSLIPLTGTAIAVIIVACLGAGLSYGLYQQALRNGYDGILSVPNYLNATLTHSNVKPSKDCPSQRSLPSSNHLETRGSYKNISEVLGRSTQSTSDSIADDDLDEIDSYSSPSSILGTFAVTTVVRSSLAIEEKAPMLLTC
jgi:hypothetical protein